MEIVHSVGPGLSGVSVELPSVLFFGSCPVRYLETLEHGAWVSVETNITNTFEEGGRVEVLSIEMHHHIGLFVEFISVDILNAHAYNNKLNTTQRRKKLRHDGFQIAESM